MNKLHPGKASDRGYVQDVQSPKKFGGMVQKMIDDKKTISKFVKGEIPSSELDARGIKFVKAL